MDHLAQDLSVALEESESCGPITFAHDGSGKWGIRRRTRSAGNLLVYMNRSPDNQGEDSTSSNSETRNENRSNCITSFHQSDSDEISFNMAIAKAMHNKSSMRMKHALHSYVRGRCSKFGVNHSLESDSVNENSPARPNLRRKRKLKRMSIDEAPIPPCGKRKRSQRLDYVDNGRSIRHTTRIRPLHQTLVDKIEKMYQNGGSTMDDVN
jgi:G patch domain-containing protein 2